MTSAETKPSAKMKPLVEQRHRGCEGRLVVVAADERVRVECARCETVWKLDAYDREIFFSSLDEWEDAL